MKIFHILTGFFFTFTCLCFLPIHGRLYSNSISSPSAAPDALSPSYDGNGPPVYNVRSFGAVGDGVSDDTQAFKLAWDTACQAEGSGTLLVPDGYIFMIQSAIFTGPCKTAVTFQIDGTIMAPDGPDSWPSHSSKRQWLVFYRINGLSMQGAGVIDGRGEKWWDLPCKPHHHKVNSNHGPCDSPVAIRFFMSSNLTVQGVKVMNSAQFHFRFDGCEDVHVENLVIKSPALSPNTDGIHIEKTNNVQIYNSLISNGDDCVSIGAGCYNVDIKNITCGPSHGISIGSLGDHNSRACVSNIRVTESVIKHSDNGVRIKTWQGGAGAVSNVKFSNIYMDTVRNPIIIDQYYCLSKDCINQTSSVFVSNVSYLNIKGTYDVRSPPIRFACSDSVPCANLTLSEVELLPAQGQIVANPFCWNAYGTMQTLTIPPVLCLLEGNPLTLPQLDVVGC